MASTSHLGSRYPLRAIWAIVGAVELLWLGWAFVAWLAAGPHVINQYRNTRLPSWSFARGYETLSLAVAAIVAIFLIRQCLRARAVVFDVLFCLSSALLVLTDPLIDMIQPLFLYSSQFTNLNSWLGNLPFVANPSATLLPEPILSQPLFYAFGLFLIISAINWIQRFYTRFVGRDSEIALFLVAFALGWAADVLISLPLAIEHLWAFPGTPNLVIFGTDINKVGGSAGYPLVTEGALTGLLFAILATVRRHNQEGHTFLEVGQVQLPQLFRVPFKVLILVGIMFTSVLLIEGTQWIAGLHSAVYPKLEPSLVNGICTPPGGVETKYGPCPGTPGYKIPLRP